MRKLWRYACLFFGLSACAPSAVVPGMTFWFGLKGYQEEMNQLAGRAERWPERQRTAESLKMTYSLTLGGSREFNRFVDLDLRRREFVIAQRSQALRSERIQEIKDELVKMNREMDQLKEIIKRQVADAVPRAQDPDRRIEAIATIGLVHLALDRFSPPDAGLSPPGSSTRVGQHTVTDFGNFHSSVTLPERATYNCLTLIFPDEGAGIQCEPLTGKP